METENGTEEFVYPKNGFLVTSLPDCQQIRTEIP